MDKPSADNDDGGQAAISDGCWSITPWQNDTWRYGLGSPWSRLHQAKGLPRSSCAATG